MPRRTRTGGSSGKANERTRRTRTRGGRNGINRTLSGKGKANRWGTATMLGRRRLKRGRKKGRIN
jgi:hypothetical protein